MFDTLAKLLASEFFWGIVIGVILSLTSAVAATKFQAIQSRNERNITIRKFLADAIGNIKEYADRLSDLRERSKVIDHEFLNLMEIEIGIYGRNREHLIWLSDDNLRKEVLDFFNRVASHIVRIRAHLNEFQKGFDLVKNGNLDQPRKTEVESAFNAQLAEAYKRCDALVTHINSHSQLIEKLRTGKP
jgi:hypothetical protein